MSIRVVARSIIQEGKLAEAKKLYAEAIAETRKEAGCILYALHEDTQAPNALAILEEWESEKHLEDHLQTPHMQRILPLLKELRQESILHIYRQII